MLFSGAYVGAGYRAPVGFGSGGRVSGGWTGGSGSPRTSPATFGSGNRCAGLTFGSGN